MLENNVFAKIISGEISVDIVYESESILAFLDIAPINKGHTLVIPKKCYVGLSTVPVEIQAEMMNVASKIGVALTKLKNWDGFNLHLNNGECAGQTVPHVHMHVVPRVGDDSFAFSWRTLEYDNKEEKNNIVKKIKEKLS